VEVAFDGPRAFQDLLELVEIGPRPSGSEGAERTRELISQRLRQAGWRVERHDFRAAPPDGRERDMTNVLGIREELEHAGGREKLADEIRAAVEDSDETEELADEEKEWIENIVEFRKEDAAGIMTPRTDMVCAEAAMTFREAVQRAESLLERIRNSPYEHGLGERLLAYINGNQEVDLWAMRPLQIARRWGSEARDTVELFLQSVRSGSPVTRRHSSSAHAARSSFVSSPGSASRSKAAS